MATCKSGTNSMLWSYQVASEPDYSKRVLAFCSDRALLLLIMKLPDQVEAVLRRKHYARRTEKMYKY